MIKRNLVKLIRFYQKRRTPRLPCCRFIPSCSEYAILAIEKYGVIIGMARAVWRFMRCNPLNRKCGVDYP